MCRWNNIETIKSLYKNEAYEELCIVKNVERE